MQGIKEGSCSLRHRFWPQIRDRNVVNKDSLSEFADINEKLRNPAHLIRSKSAKVQGEIPDDCKGLKSRG